MNFQHHDDVMAYCSLKVKPVESCERLEGGLTNYVYRIYYKDGTTAVFKHYPLHLSYNIEKTFPQSRYFVELKSLQLFNQLSDDFLKVPKVIAHFDDDYTLIMEDAGTTVLTLMDCIERDEKLDYSAIGKRVAAFLYKLNNYKDLTDSFHNTLALETNDAYYQVFLKKSESICPDLMEKYKNKPFPHMPSHKCIIMGDLWPNSIVINPQTQVAWILDWEIARIGNGFDDISQCCANLFLMKDSPEKYAITHINAFEQSLIANYKSLTNYSPTEHDILRFLVFVVLLVDFPNWNIKDSNKTVKDAFDLSQVYFTH